MGQREILGRDDELARLTDSVDAVEKGAGAVLLTIGPAGIGKTALLRETRRLAEERGARVLGAAASELDVDFPFGLVHQLLDGVIAEADAERQARLLAGAAARAEVVLAPSAGPGPPEDPGHAVIHGLYWLLANLAEEAPLVLLVDDLHWADRPSLRLLEYLSRRVESLPLLVLGTLRPGEAGGNADLLAALETAPATAVLRPRPLEEDAVAALLAAAVEGEPEPAFVRACAEATGGNPLLLRALARQAAENQLGGRAAEADDVAALAATELGVVVRRRLGALGAGAIAVAQAAAVLGEPARLADLAAVAGLSQEAGAEAADRLAAAELLEPPGWGFVHPILREAVTAGISPAELTRLHSLAARRMREADAVPARVAVHLLASAPAADPEVVECLRVAARGAAAEGAPETGVVYLRRALEEPVAGSGRAGLLLELGELESRTGDPAGAARLTAALDAGLPGDEAARARAARGALQLHLDPIPALEEFAAALAAATDPALRLRLEALLLEASVFHVEFAPAAPSCSRPGGRSRSRPRYCSLTSPRSRPSPAGRRPRPPSWRGAPATATRCCARSARRPAPSTYSSTPSGPARIRRPRGRCSSAAKPSPAATACASRTSSSSTRPPTGTGTTARWRPASRTPRSASRRPAAAASR